MIRARRPLLAPLAALLALAGCSLVIDTEGDYDDPPAPDGALADGGLDAALDAAPPPDDGVDGAPDPVDGADPDAALADGGPAPYACRVPGLTAGLWAQGQDPRDGVGYGEAQARERLEIIARATSAVRLESAQFDGQAACIAKRTLGLRVTLGAWIDGDAASNRAELDAAVMAASLGCVDDVLVGSEVLLRGDLHAEALAALIEETRARVPDRVRVGTADDWAQLVSHRRVVEASDVLVAHAGAYPAGVGAAEAAAYARAAHARVAAVAGDREVGLGAIGLPTEGEANGRAVPGVEAASRVLVEVTSWAEEAGVAVYFAAAFDESWRDPQGGARARWGVFDAWGALKPGLAPVFDCARALPDLPPLPPSNCRPVAPSGEELLRDGDFTAACEAWAPGWVPETSGSACIEGVEHDRRDRGAGGGLYAYTSAEDVAPAGAFSWREQRVPFTGAWSGLASVWVRDVALRRGHAFVHLVYENDAGQPVGGDERVLTADVHAEQGAEWVELTVDGGAAPCEATAARVRVGVRKTDRGQPAVAASLDDVSLIAE